MTYENLATGLLARQFINLKKLHEIVKTREHKTFANFANKQAKKLFKKYCDLDKIPVLIDLDKEAHEYIEGLADTSKKGLYRDSLSKSSRSVNAGKNI